MSECDNVLWALRRRGFFDFYKDECLVKAGGEATGTLSLRQIHTYAHDGKFSPGSPFAWSSELTLTSLPEYR